MAFSVLGTVFSVAGRTLPLVEVMAGELDYGLTAATAVAFVRELLHVRSPARQ